MEQNPLKNTVPFYAVALLWLLYALLFPLYAPLHYALLAAASVVVFCGVRLLCRSKARPDTVQKAQPKPKEAPEKEKSTGDPEVDRMRRDGRLAIAELKRLDENIEDAEISACIVRMERAAEQIFRAVEQTPGKLSQIRRFMDYYLPTTLKLLNQYDRMQAASGGAVDSTLARVEGVMQTIASAFEQQLDKLYSADAMDISADITVLENMLAREGLAGGRKAAVETAPGDDTSIRLEL